MECARPEFGTEFGPDVGQNSGMSRCAAGKEAVTDRERARAAVWTDYVARVELSLPVKPSSSVADFTKETNIRLSLRGGEG